MFDDYTEEHLSSWNDADVVEWKEKAATVIKQYYLSFGDRQWDEYDLPAERNLLRAKICFALYGPPTTEADCIENAYSEDRAKKTRAEELIKQIQTVKTPFTLTFSCHSFGSNNSRPKMQMQYF